MKGLNKMNCTQLAVTLIASMLGVGCGSVEKTFKDKPQLLKFATQHPIAAAAIGRDDGSLNLTSNAIRFSTRLGLDNQKNGDGRGTQVNAIRHSLWQAAISARFGQDIAKKAGDAYEKNGRQRDILQYPDRYSADEAVDLRNNAIGRQMGHSYRDENMKQLTARLLNHYYQTGLWLANPVKENGKTVWRISQNRLDEKQFNQAMKALEKLDEYGRTAKEMNTNSK